ncbi:MAG: transcriptional repressor LexA [Planctomycetes bacterium]|nr:transcriptional repressor LexA [Planctomycetota bacterium]MCB9870566.1 transcriptional repressor LexA [Planctomycetota bacterium]
MSINLTEKQLKVLRFYRDHRARHGLCPTLEEAAANLGITKVTVYEHLNQLIAKGAVRRDKAKARSVTILFDPDEQDAAFEHPSLPILGSIAAGRPIEAVEDREDVLLTDLVPHGDRHYLLRVRGKSMIEDHIDDGDLVVVEQRPTARNGEIVVAIVDGDEATLKRFYREDGRIRLQPANSELDPIYPENCEIRGVVRGVIRRFSKV